MPYQLLSIGTCVPLCEVPRKPGYFNACGHAAIGEADDQSPRDPGRDISSDTSSRLMGVNSIAGGRGENESEG